MQVGDTLVFIGKNVKDDHFKNFTYGRKYIIEDFFSNLPDADSLGTHTAIFFKDIKFGCLMSKIDTYFLPLEKYRNLKLKNIL